MIDHAVHLQGVEKRYKPSLFGKGIYALRGVDIDIPRGAIFGLLGPNGAGKSTLVKIMMTVIRPTVCRGTILGQPVGDKSTLSQVGYLPEHHRFPDYLTAAQVVDYFGSMSGLDRATRRVRVPELLELVGLKPWQHNRIREFSKGMRQRVGIAQALVSDPQLVILDEPTDGVDPVGRRDIRNVLLEQRRRGRTVLLNSHLLSELEMVCDTVAMMVQGKVWAQGTVEWLTRYGVRYTIEVSPPRDAPEGQSVAGLVSAAVRGLISFSPDLALPRRDWQPADPDRQVLHGGMPQPIGGDGADALVELDNGTLSIGVSDAIAVQPVLDALRRAGLVISSARPMRPNLEELFMKAVTNQTTGKVMGPGANLDAPAPKGGSAVLQEAETASVGGAR